jgi:hypothetical protein
MDATPLNEASIVLKNISIRVSGMVLLQTISFGGFWNGSTAMFLEWFYCSV